MRRSVRAESETRPVLIMSMMDYVYDVGFRSALTDLQNIYKIALDKTLGGFNVVNDFFYL